MLSSCTGTQHACTLTEKHKGSSKRTQSRQRAHASMPLYNKTCTWFESRARRCMGSLLAYRHSTPHILSHTCACSASSTAASFCCAPSSWPSRCLMSSANRCASLLRFKMTCSQLRTPCSTHATGQLDTCKLSGKGICRHAHVIETGSHSPSLRILFFCISSSIVPSVMSLYTWTSSIWPCR